jgi:NADPH-dependent glutamate synthase beta subunit-like oxidoreductase
MASSFLKLCHAQTCGKCVPCRIGLGQLKNLLEDVLDGRAELETIELIETTARSIFASADCAIGYEAALMVIRGLEGFRDDYEEHILRRKCTNSLNQPVPCVASCPAGVDIPGYIALIAEGKNEDAVRLIRNDNPMPVVCAMICEHPCEARCRRNIIDNPVNIRGLKRYAVDSASNVPVPENLPDTGKRIAVIGGGPGGLSAAYYLALMGHGVTIFEQRNKLGGMLRYGIPNYRLPRERLDAEIAAILSTGISVKTNTVIGDNLSIKTLRDEFDAVYIAIGAHTNKTISIEGENSTGVTSAVEMLRDIGDNILPDYSGKTVVVVGGGNVAMDAARSALRCNAKKVYLAYRRRRNDMTALGEEIEGAVSEGCELLALHAPKRIESNEKGEVTAIWIQPQIISVYENNRPKAVNASTEEVRIPCDVIIVAIGQGIESHQFEKFGIPVKKGVIDALNWSGIQDIPGVFAGGDCVTGPATVIRAIAAGKVAAANIDEYLGFNHLVTEEIDIPEARHDNRPPCGRVNMTELSVSERACGFMPIEIGMTAEESAQESRRCLRCDHFGYGAFKGGRVHTW